MVDSPGRITLWGVEVFVATAEEGSISAAARRLGASPSAVSQQLSNLETALGTSLLIRNARPVALTAAGDLFRRRASSILNEAALARAELAMADMAQLTRFRIGMIEDFEADVTPALLTHLAAELPQCQFQLATGASHSLFDQLEARALDVIIAAEMGAEGDWIEVHPLLEEGFVVAAPKGMFTAGTASDLRAQLQTKALVQYTTRHHMGRLLAAHLARQNLRPDHRFELDSYHAILALVAQGVGWTILTPLALHRAQRFAPDLEVFALPFPPLSRRISLFARRDSLQDMPAEVAVVMRDILQRQIIHPNVTAHPFMRDVLEVI
ncbi:LysR family transcriptional regulator [Thalassobius sp. Cn5-15]|jgi:DNA-binding transcriptional LysR family regulator|uniref:LysR family transcriptional regulator n=1 Tax=Thalassobius sp. Cn5-15 TaxID=2917763 RepID=UPI001EF28F57|nr:LysR family transcriptional regulator [Thalassobius sp. Cn5-15]MCG7494434.1 LysR family transcriptional regulator [Thalassobius sp. Cn5-15]